MTTDRRLYSMELGRRDHTRWLGVHRVSSRLTLPTTNLLAAYDARAGVTDVSGACSAWADQSGNGWHATQGTAGSRPTISSTGGYPSLLFDGTADSLSVPGITASAGTKSIYAVVNPVGSGTSVSRAVFDAQTGRIFVGQINTDGKIGTYDGLSLRSSGITAGDVLQRQTWSVGSGTSRVWRNGIEGTAGGYGNTAPIGGTVAIGARNDGMALYFSGHILFLAIYNAARNTAVEDYITQEWGV